MKEECLHLYKKTLSETGMYYVERCCKCHATRHWPFNADNLLVIDKFLSGFKNN